MLMLLLSTLALAEEPAAQANAAPPALRNVEAEAVRGKCESPQLEKMRNKKPPGADQHYAGVFTVNADGTVTGVEKRLLFANAIWKARPAEQKGTDCEVIWTIQGTKTQPSACTDCSFAIQFQADVDYDASSCPKRITIDGNHFRQSYDIKVAADGGIEVFFSNSGNPLGRGYSSGNQYNWLSPHQCAWF